MQTEARPLVSVVVPVYNPGEYFAPFLASLQAQTLQNWQAILVDDGSTDGSAERIDSAARADARILAVHQPNSGAAAARARGVALAEGEFLLCVDSDDLMHPQMLRALVQACQSQNAQLAFCRFAPFTETPSPDTEPPAGRSLSGQAAREMLLHDQRLDYALSNKLFRAGVLTADMLRCPYRYNEDLLASWRAFAAVQTAVFLDFDGYHCRQHAASTSHSGITLPFLTDQLAVAKRILLDAEGTSLQASAKAFYYEKLLYLESMILRQSAQSEFDSLHSTLRAELRYGFHDAMHSAFLGTGMKACALLSRRVPPVWHAVCRLLLRDKR